MSCVTERTGLDGLVINLEESYELRDWMKAFECTEQQLRQAIAAAGNSADEVRDYLDSDREQGAGHASQAHKSTQIH